MATKGTQMKQVRSSADIAKAIISRMKREQTNPFALAHRIAPALGVTPHAVDNRLRRMIAKETIELDFAIVVCEELGLRVSIGEA